MKNSPTVPSVLGTYIHTEHIFFLNVSLLDVNFGEALSISHNPMQKIRSNLHSNFSEK